MAGRAVPGRATFVQANLSTSAAGVLRGLHLHRRQDDLWIVADGRAFVALVDVRPLARRDRPAPSSRRASWRPTSGSTSRPASPTASSPLEPLQLIYLVTNEYDGSDELGFAWDDPAVAVALAGARRRRPDGRPILSERDAANPPLADLVVRLRPDRPDPDRTRPPGPHRRTTRRG